MAIYDYTARLISGEEKALADYKGKIVLIVNTATKCGFTQQLEGLQTLYNRFKDKGFIVLGFPCNQFMNQEPGTNKEVQEVCQLQYGVQFPLFQKVDVKGKQAHPLFKYLTSERGGVLTSEIKWNFTKFLLDREGNIIKRYAPTTKPEKIATDINLLIAKY